MRATGSQYEARQVDEDDIYTHQVYEPDGIHYLGPNMTPAQAEIFAFGLNAIAAGHTLQYVTEEPDREGNNVFEYEGPTEGIRA